MYADLLRRWLLASAILAVGGCGDGRSPDAPERDNRLTLTTPSRDYLLGEPVVLNLAFRNLSKEPIKVVEIFVNSGRYEAPPWIARKGEPFEQFRPQITDLKASRRVLSVSPQETLNYQYRVVGAPWPKFRLAFPTANEYLVFVSLGSQQNPTSASNVVEVRIKQPEGEDAKVWKQLNDPSFLTLLQIERVDERAKDVPLKMAELLAAFPKSGYAPAMRRALAKVYFHSRFALSSEKDRARLAEVLGITLIDTLPDKRLDVRLNELLQKETPLGSALKSLNQLGVPLDAVPELKTKKVTVAEAYFTLRLAMRSLSDELEASWERRGDGYVLVPVDPAKRPPMKGDGDGRD